MTTPEDFVAAEAALLDAGRFDDWLALFTEDGHYWVPLQGAAQADPFSHNSIAYEDRLMKNDFTHRHRHETIHARTPVRLDSSGHVDVTKNDTAKNGSRGICIARQQRNSDSWITG